MSTLKSRRRRKTAKIYVEGDDCGGRLHGPRAIIHSLGQIWNRLAIAAQANLDRRLLDHAMELGHASRVLDGLAWCEHEDTENWLSIFLATARRVERRFSEWATDAPSRAAQREVAGLVDAVIFLGDALRRGAARTRRPQTPAL